MSSSSSSSSSKICFNPDCKEPKSEPPRKGWRLRAGDFAELCDRCGSAYEEVRFCETFHSDAAGWRNCESCGKKVHCGCIASMHVFILLDAGGIECMACARKTFIMASNQIWPPSLFPPPPLPERLKDLPVKSWNQMTGPSSVPGPWWQGTNLWNNVTNQPDLRQRIAYDVDRPNNVDKLITGERSSPSAQEKKKVKDAPERTTSTSLKLTALDRLANGNVGADALATFSAFRKEESKMDCLQDAGHITGDDPVDKRKGINGAAEPGMNSSVAGMNISLSSSTPKDEPSTSLFGLGVSLSSPNETSEPAKVSGLPSQQQTPSVSLAKHIFSNPHNGGDSSVELQTQIRNGRPRGDGQRRNQLLPRYWPRITDQELQQITGDSNSVITPLFEKMLSASDAGRIGRLVLPKKCAEYVLEKHPFTWHEVPEVRRPTDVFRKTCEMRGIDVYAYREQAYFPTISQSEGLPLKVQDATGKDWVFQFRFWPNNNSRMYVLEGVTPCIQSMQLQAGDTVTFSRIDPEGKLVMGFRKASSVSSEQDAQAPKTGNGFSSNGENIKNAKPSEVGSTFPLRPFKGGSESTTISSINHINPTDPAYPWSKFDKAGYIQKEGIGAKSSPLSTKRKNSILGPKSKRLRINNDDSMELKLTWEEAQELLRPPPNHVPTIVVIEGHEFEEYEEAPVLGKPTIFTSNLAGEKNQWAQCEDCSKWRKLPLDAILPARWTCSDNIIDPKRNSCSAAQEITTEQLEDLVFSNIGRSKRSKTKEEPDAVEVVEGLDTLANLAILGEGEALPSSAQPTTKHPRHRPGCTCIVCIQPPSGKGPKHKQTCTCNVCLTVKRRFRTLMLRREKRQSEKEAERKKQQFQLPEKPELQDEVSGNQGNGSPSQKTVANGDDDDHSRRKSSSPFKGGIDLNIQPEREEEPCPVSDSGNMMRLLRDATELYLKQQSSETPIGSGEQVILQVEPSGSTGGERPNASSHKTAHPDADKDRPVSISMTMSASTSATG